MKMSILGAFTSAVEARMRAVNDFYNESTSTAIDPEGWRGGASVCPSGYPRVVAGAQVIGLQAAVNGVLWLGLWSNIHRGVSNGAS